MIKDNSKQFIDQGFNIKSESQPNQEENTYQITNHHHHHHFNTSSSTSTSASKSNTNANKKHPRSISPRFHSTLNDSFLDQTSQLNSQNFESVLNQNRSTSTSSKHLHHQLKLNPTESQYNLDTRAEKLKNVIERQHHQIQIIQNQISLLDQFSPTSAYSIYQNSHQPTRFNQSSSQHSNHLMHSNQFSTSTSIHNLNSHHHHHHSTITPKPRPSLPARVLVGYPLRGPSPGHDPTIPKAIAPVGLNPTMEEIINCPQRGQQAHSISFLLNPSMNPAKETIRDSTPPPSSYSNLSPLNSHQSNQNSHPDQNHHRRPSDQPTLNSERSQQVNENSTAQVPPPTLYRRTVPIPGSGYRNLNGRSPNEPLELRANDLIGTGRVTCYHAQAYWDLFFQKHSNRLTWCQSDREEIDSIRSVSDLLLASVLSVSAKVLGHNAIFETCLDEAKTLT
ncbi:uncharacterized protein MELLADRAFT_76552, partial [Melampsora larici-populina 98AG31]